MKYDQTKENQNEFQCVLGFQEEVNIIFELVFCQTKSLFYDIDSDQKQLRSNSRLKGRTRFTHTNKLWIFLSFNAIMFTGWDYFGQFGDLENIFITFSKDVDENVMPNF